MDTVEFRVVADQVDWTVEPVARIHPVINGVLLADLVRDAERSGAETERASAGLVGAVSPSGARVYATDSSHDADGTTLLGCSCDNATCSPITATIRIGADVVEWSNFATHLEFLHSLGPYVFARAAYDEKLAEAAERA